MFLNLRKTPAESPTGYAGEKLPQSRSEALWPGIYLLFIAGFILRIVFGIVNGTSHYPDELLCYMEQAHRVVFGYGYVPWDYSYGARSWIFSFFLSSVLFPFKWLAIDSPLYYIPFIRGVLCLIASTMIVSGYVIARNLVSERAGRVTAFLICVWYELIYFAPRSFTEVVAASIFMAALALYVTRTSGWRSYLLGMALALVGALRMQYAPLSALVGIAVLFNYPRADTYRVVVGAAITLLFVGFVDYITLGQWFISYHNYYTYAYRNEVLEAGSDRVFVWYLIMLVFASFWLLPAAYIFAWPLRKKLWLPMALVALLLITHSIPANKQYRAIFVVIPLLLTIAGSVASERVKGLWERRSKIWQCVLFVIAFSGLGMENGIFGEKFIYFPEPLYKRDEILDSYLYLSDKSVHAVLMDAPVGWYRTGGYFYLHHNVPIYFTEAMRAADKVGFKGDPREYVSHIIKPNDEPVPEGFRFLTRIGALTIYENDHPPQEYKVVPGYSRIVIQEGIAERFAPPARFFLQDAI